MTTNLGSSDRIIRTITALLIGALYFGGILSGTTAIVLGTLAVILFFTGSIGFCPMYMPFRFSTKKIQKAA